MTDYKQKDRDAILGYLRGRNSAKVSDIINESGADKMRVYPILFELEQAGVISTKTNDDFGAAETVTLII